MNSIYKLLETYTAGYTGEFLDILSLISIIFGIFTIISKNPIVSVLFLIFLFSSVSIYLIMLGINFVGISYLLVYVGAVSILFLFILMLINIRISELLSATSNSVPLAVIITISFYYPLSKIISYNTAKTISYVDVKPKELGDYFTIITQTLKNNIEISYATSKNWDGALAETTDITSIGNIMYSSHAIWLLITSIILLLAMIGAIVITIK